MNHFFDADSIRKTIAIMKPDGQLFECRIIGDGKKQNFSGYFTSAEKLIESLEVVNLRGKTMYLTLNHIDTACYSRSQRDSFRQNTTTTSDGDVTRYQWLLVDLDPERPTGVSSTDAELKAAAELAGKVYNYLADIGFSEPVKALSGNGYHLLYRIDLENNETNVELIHRCLEVLDEMFSNPAVHVDTVNYNPSRICKLHGTLAQKGADTLERPHRMSRIFSNQMNIEVTDVMYLEKLCKQLPVKIAPKKSSVPTTYQKQEFNLESFLKNNGVSYQEMRNTGRDGSTIYALDECPFNSTHTDGDAKIFKYPDGAISFRCHHNSCSRYRWQDVRTLFEPDAYDKPEIDDHIDKGFQAHNRYKNQQQVQNVVDDGTPMFRSASEIFEDDEPMHEYIASGITEIDTLMHGFEKQALSVMSGLRACGKTTLLGNVICKAVDDGHTVVVYSGEMSNKKYLNWIIRQAAGKRYIEVSMQYQNGAGVPDPIQRKIVSWMGENFWLYNNRCGNDFTRISNELRKILIEKRADLCIVDNLMALDLSSFDRDKYEAQTKFVLSLKALAIETNTHILCVAHPKKAGGFIRLEDISGSSNIGNAVDNAFLVHRCNADFKKMFTEYFKCTLDSKNIGDCDNVIEIAKDRENGTMDHFVPIYFEPDSKRFLNTPDEVIHYFWEEDEKIEWPAQ